MFLSKELAKAIVYIDGINSKRRCDLGCCLKASQEGARFYPYCMLHRFAASPIPQDLFNTLSEVFTSFSGLLRTYRRQSSIMIYRAMEVSVGWALGFQLI